MAKKTLTESESHYDHLEKMTVSEILTNINKEDAKVSEAIKAAQPQIEKLIDSILPRMLDGGRLFYIGSGTSGRLGIVDASECPPTFGVSHDLVVGLIAGGDGAIRRAVEFAEDDETEGWKDLQAFDIAKNDSLIGIAASGRTPYVIGAVESANSHGILTGCITCNEDSKLAKESRFPVEVLVGPEFLTGSTRMKAGTAQKLVLNMISTSLMIKLGRVKGNRMVDMQLTNQKLIERGVAMLMHELGFSEETARENLNKYGSVRKVLGFFSSKKKS
ncbi:MAG: N-acetylmuramic acid 6-phosphate etherase [Cyclobacteriaceae bacterium]